MNLTPSDVLAIRESIAHWRRMRADVRGTEERPFGSDCALCRIYRYGRCKDEDGANCPVVCATEAYCVETPYRAAHDAWVRYVTYRDDSAREAWEHAADEEIAFLEGLLP